MAWLPPSIKSLIQQFVSNIEGFLGQGTPASNLAYNKVISGATGMAVGGLYRFAIDRGKAVLAQTAQGADLDALAAEYGLTREPATAAVVQVNLPASDGTAVLLGTILMGPNGLQYQSIASTTAPSDGISGHGATFLVQCLDLGSQGNIGVSSTLTLLSPIIGTTPPATVTSITATGCVTAVDAELDPALQQRVLTVERAYGGGGNASDYRAWGQSAAGVANVYPYAGLPYYGQLSSANCYAAQAILIQGSPTGGTFTLNFNGQTSAALNYNCAASDVQTALQALSGAGAVLVSLLANGGFLCSGFSSAAPVTLGTNSLTGGTTPTVYVIPNSAPARTVYVECLPAINADGIAPSAVLTAVTAAIRYNSQGDANQPLGLSMDSLYVQPILRTSFYVTITSLYVPSGQTGTVQAAVLTALINFFLTLFPFVDGVDPAFTRNDLVTQPNISAAIQSVLNAYGASCANVGFGTASGAFISTYQLGQGEKAKLAASGGITWL